MFTVAFDGVADVSYLVSLPFMGMLTFALAMAFLFATMVAFVFVCLLSMVIVMCFFGKGVITMLMRCLGWLFCWFMTCSDGFLEWFSSFRWLL